MSYRGGVGLNILRAVVFFTVGQINEENAEPGTEIILHIVVKFQVNHVCLQRGKRA